MVLIAASAYPASSAGLNAMENFMRTVKSGKADFVQVVTAPPKDGQAARSKTSRGSFSFVRPQRFRFDYRQPFEQTIVADGQTIWLYDVDLNQVTARKQSQALSSTPAALVAAAVDVKDLQSDFVLQEQPDKDGLSWLQATPKAKDGQIQQLRVGFKGDLLAVLEIADSFGQRSVLTFQNFEANAAVPASTFQFKPPAGADVVRQ
ncbi:outer membrane lipoprotein chaperone LolA [Curvibacter sp. CHRR-16]|uniref:outer membrane lipoprotein chaperone LolA n=1 Tax=Curvibacter sp. CHRR-16 TaxID=2835872 RepID=UPI001BDA500D|nr:outer membrane lipoprotein chaperone LolA [Curvibacter sp. CHRR-16]MBT0571570.1 outer membrane lipoprotein chaperone LolA [Curvibacter sp. CHRR-16]